MPGIVLSWGFSPVGAGAYDGPHRTRCEFAPIQCGNGHGTAGASRAPPPTVSDVYAERELASARRMEFDKLEFNEVIRDGYFFQKWQ